MRLKHYSILLVICLFMFSCNDCPEMSFCVNKEYSAEKIESFNFCTDTTAVFESLSYYNTIEGKAILEIPIPEGHRLKRLRQTKNSVDFITEGEEFSRAFTTYTIKLEGLSKKEGEILTVNLRIDEKSNDKCGVNTKGEKKKTSEIKGQPLWGNDKE